MTDLELKKSLLTCPGDTIQEHIDHIGMSQAELAERLGRSVPKLNELIKGKAPITKETATKLEFVLGVPASFWLNLERAYQDELLELEQMEYLESCIEWIKGFPIKWMKDWGLLPNTTDKLALAKGLLSFFRIGSPKEWHFIYQESSLAFKIELKHTAEPQAISVWLRLGELQAENIDLAPFDKKKVRAHYDTFHNICFNHSDTWLDELQNLCASCGIALVYTPCLAKAPIYGASRWIKGYSLPLIQITDRRKDYNAFWFTFYHELAHILKHGKKDIFIEGLEEIVPDIDKEVEADAFASRMLLSDKERNELEKYPAFSNELIVELSRKFQRHPGIIVAQLQRQKAISYSNVHLNSLKVKVVFNKITV